MDKSIMDAKAADEATLRAAYKADAKNAGAADPWDRLRRPRSYNTKSISSLRYLERLRGFASGLPQVARILVRAAEEKPKPKAIVCVSSAILGCRRSSSSCSPPRRSTRVWTRFFWRIRWPTCRTRWAKDNADVQKRPERQDSRRRSERHDCGHQAG